MSAIEEVPDATPLRKLWSCVFASNDPFSDPFQRTVQARVLLYPTYGYHLSEDQYEALTEACRELGETSFFVSIVEYAGDFFAEGKHWYCEIPSYKEYLTIPLVLESAIYSGEGTFGMILSHEDHAILGGTSHFIEAMKLHYAQWPEDRRRLKAEWPPELSDPVLDATAPDSDSGDRI